MTVGGAGAPFDAGACLPRVDLPAPDLPRVSVLVLAWRQADRLHTCLAALARQRASPVPFETIVVLNGATERVTEVVERTLTGARVLRSSINLGFGGGCNLAATAARGEYLVLLNDDTEVEDGWLDALVEAADGNPSAGAVGSRISDAAGLLQEAGAIVWADGSVWHVGRLLPRASPRYRYLREVDYCSACSLLVRRSTWDAVGGFDEGYYPGYYEDLDLCMSIDALGQRILYQPLARLCHHGGGEEGSLDFQTKAFVAGRSRERFLLKWSDRLAEKVAPPPEQPPAPSVVHHIERAVHRARRRPWRALVVDDDLADPGDGPPFTRMLAAVAQMAGAGYAVTVCCPTREQRGRDELGRQGADVVAGHHLATHLADPRVLYEAVVLSGSAAFTRVAPLVRAGQTLAAVIYHVGIEEPDASAVRSADRVVCLAETHKDLLARLGPHPPVDVLPLVGLAPRSQIGFEGRRHVLVAACPNDGGWTDWVLDEVLPLLRAMRPWVRLRLAHAPPPKGRTQSGASTVSLGPTADLAAEYGRARVVVAWGPLQAAEALAYGVPVVCSPGTADLLPQEVAQALVVADDVRATAEAIQRLLTDRRSWEERRAVIDRAPPGEASCDWAGVLDAARRRRGQSSGLSSTQTA